MAATVAREKWVGVPEVAEHLGIGKESIYRWIEERHLPVYRVGRLLRFRLSEIDLWVQRTGNAETKPGDHSVREEA